MSHPFELQLSELKSLFDNKNVNLNTNLPQSNNNNSSNKLISELLVEGGNYSDMTTQAMEEEGGHDPRATTLAMGEEGGCYTPPIAITEVLGEAG